VSLLITTERGAVIVSFTWTTDDVRSLASTDDVGFTASTDDVRLATDDVRSLAVDVLGFGARGARVARDTTDNVGFTASTDNVGFTASTDDVGFTAFTVHLATDDVRSLTVDVLGFRARGARDTADDVGFTAPTVDVRLATDDVGSATGVDDVAAATDDVLTTGGALLTARDIGFGLALRIFTLFGTFTLRSDDVDFGECFFDGSFTADVPADEVRSKKK